MGFKLTILLGCAVLLEARPALGAPAEGPGSSGKLVLDARSRVETAKGSGLDRLVLKRLELEPARTAAVVCDMWDQHWCQGATRRVADMAPRMNELLKALRSRGVLVIHCPSGTLGRYEGSPGRKLAQSAPKVEPKTPLQGWCGIEKAREGDLPIDDSDGGCDCEPQCKQGSPWRGQIAAIEIHDADAITDSAEAYYLMRQRGIENVLVMGVHTNMCVLGRPFSIRQLVHQGLNVLLVRDMTDTMYNARRRPFVPHHGGTDLVVGHIERHWCPTVTSDQVLGGRPFRFRDDGRKVLGAVISEPEYDTDATLPAFASRRLAKAFDVRYALRDPLDANAFAGLEALDEADALLLSAWRRTPPAAQMELLRKLVASGKPIAAIRTASHAFQRRSGWELPAGHAEWPDFDREVLGGHYTGHHGNVPDGAERSYVWAVPERRSHPILAGFPEGEVLVASWLYKSQPLGERAQALLLGRAGDRKPHEPVAWTHTHPGRGRVFYTSLGSPDDFKLPAFERLLENGIHWAAGLAAPEEAAGGTKRP
ncbi:MAG: ThuA domain-containing protein [Planctomycetes bacterium]|nr:ThuA domain-containing protein [Planctomycetota bacterium]